MTTWYESNNPNGFVTGKRFSVDLPSVTIMAAGMGGDSYGHWHLCRDGRSNGGGQAQMTDEGTKPPYRVPSMAEVAAIPWNGLTVASTFSGAGGSCLGYRMAGYRVVWANEFVPIACESYEANAAPGCILDRRDIRSVTAEDILAATGLAAGELDLFDGSPPCQAFSTAGKREKGWGTERHYEHGASQKNEELFFEYIRLLDGLKPRTFIAENVSGLVKGTAKGFFLEILRGLKACGYRVEARLLDAQWLGVPQTRQRVIFMGVRDDLDRAPAFPKPLPYRYSVREALPELAGAEMIAGNDAFRPKWASVDDGPTPTLVASGAHGGSGPVRFRHDEAGAWSGGDVTDTPAPTGRSGRAGTMFVEGANGFDGHALRSADMPSAAMPGSRPTAVEIVHPSGCPAGRVDSIDDPSGAVMARPGGIGGTGPGQTFVQAGTERRKFTIAEVKRLCAFPDDFILVGSYAQQWERLGNSVPPVMMRHIAEAVRDGVLLPTAERAA